MSAPITSLCWKTTSTSAGGTCVCAETATTPLLAGGWRETAAVVRHLTIDTWGWLVTLVAFALLDLSAAMLVVLLLSAFLTFRRLGGQTGPNIVGYGPYRRAPSRFPRGADDAACSIGVTGPARADRATAY